MFIKNFSKIFLFRALHIKMKIFVFLEILG